LLNASGEAAVMPALTTFDPPSRDGRRRRNCNKLVAADPAGADLWGFQPVQRTP